MQSKWLALLVVLALAACSGGSKSSSTTTTTTTVNSPAAGTSPGAAAPASPGTASSSTMSTQAAPIPQSLHCADGSPVWANTKTHAYHVASDPFYGRTKHGKYMCTQDAVAAGYHAAGAGMRHHHVKSSGQVQPAQSP